MAKKNPELKKVNLKEEFDITDFLYKSLAKLLQEGQIQIDIHYYPQFDSLLKERKLTYEYDDENNIFKLKDIWKKSKNS